MSSPNSEAHPKLYEKTLSIHIKEPQTGESRESTKLTLCLEWQNATAAGHNKELSVYLTDPSDPFFMYSLRLDSSDFVELKHEQGLLVDFTAFPQSVINLLGSCSQEENKKNPKFLLNLTLNQEESAAAILNVVELNQFKVLTHLSLKFSSPPDIVIKHYLTTCFKNLKKENETLKTKSSCLQQELEKQISLSKDVQANHDVKVHSIQNKIESELLAARRHHEEQLKLEREKASQAYNSECRKLKEQQSEMECNYNNRLKNHESKISKLEEALKKKQEKINYLEQSNYELESSLESSKKDVADTNRDLLTFKKHNEKLHFRIQEAEHQLESLHVFKIEATERLAAQDSEIAQRQAAIDEVHKEKKSLESNISVLKTELNKSQDLEVMLKRDISKANQIIRKFQIEARSMNSELKGRAQIVANLEHMLRERDGLEKALRDDIKTARATIQSQENEIDYTKLQIVSLKTKLSESEAKLQNKDEATTTPKVSDPQITKNPSEQKIQSAAYPNIQYSQMPVNVRNYSPHQHSISTLEARYFEKHPKALTAIQNVNDHDDDEEDEDDEEVREVYRGTQPVPSTANGNTNWRPFEMVKDR